MRALAGVYHVQLSCFSQHRTSQGSLKSVKIDDLDRTFVVNNLIVRKMKSA
jgi:hypothetical protein